MDRHSDLPLFRWTPPPMEVIPFPTARRVGKIRQAALGIINAPTPRAEAGLWLRMTNSMASQMRKAGIAEARVENEMAAFFDAVQRELDRRMAGASRRGGGDAA